MWELPSEPCARAVAGTAQLWVWGTCCPSPPCPLLSTQGLFSSTPCIITKLQLEDSTHRDWEQLALMLACACFLFLLLHQGSHNSGVHPLLLCSGDEPSLVPSHPFPQLHLLQWLLFLKQVLFSVLSPQSCIPQRPTLSCWYLLAVVRC